MLEIAEQIFENKAGVILERKNPLIFKKYIFFYISHIIIRGGSYFLTSFSVPPRMEIYKLLCFYCQSAIKTS